MRDKNLPQFTCKKCGGHKLTVTHIWNIQVGNENECWREWGPLKDDHHWKYEFKEKVEPKTKDEVQRGDFGNFADDNSSSEPEEYETHEAETDRENDEIYVNCESCDREIEFGWSQINRYGLILPAENINFIPSESWPDPKYLDSWRQKGWLRAGHLQP